MRSDFDKETSEKLETQKSLQERMAPLEHANSFSKPPNSSGFQGRECRKDACMCVIGGYDVLARDQAIQVVRSALHGVNGITKVEAPGNIPKICFVSFSSPDGMRDVVHQQKSNSQFG